MSNYKQVKINFKESDYILLSDVANAKNISIAEFIRQILGTHITNTPKNRRRKCSTINKVTLYYLSQTSKSLNEIANNCNLNKSIDRMVLIQINHLKNAVASLTK